MSNEQTTQDRLRNQVLHIVNTIENGIEVTENNKDEYYDLEVGDYISGFDYLQDVLGITYTVSSDKEYLGANLLVAFGGPNITIDTRNRTVNGYWWGDNVSISYNEDNIGLDDALEELYNS